MRSLSLPGTALVSALAATTTWLTVSSWSGFSAKPSTYLVPVLVGCGLVAMSGALLRSARLHPAVVALAQTALVAVWLNHRFASDSAMLGWLPTPTSLRDSLDVLAASVDAAKSYAAPVPESVTALPPVLIMIGSLAAVVVDLLACGLRRVPLAGLPLLAMYTAPVSVLGGGVTWWTFALIAVGFLSLLAAEEASRLAHWGRGLAQFPGGDHRPRGINQTVWPSARKIGFTATAMAVVLPVFVPTFSSGILSGSGIGDGPGAGGVRISNPILNLKRDLERGQDVPLLTVTTSDPAPSYLRVAVLDVFDGARWKPGRRDIPVQQRVEDGIPAPPGLSSGVSGTPQNYQIAAATGFKSGWLPTPYPYIDVSVGGDWRYDASTLDIVSAAKGKTTSGLDYQVLGVDLKPTAAQLESAGPTPSKLFSRYTDVASEVPDDVGELAKRVTAAGTNRAERAALLQDWFAKPHADEARDPSFTYDLNQARDGSSIGALTDFLTTSRTGYCEQFAGAMALMARTLSIPARVAVGFLRPERTGRPGGWVFSSHDLHAWPELYFEGVGWVLFEPTPAGRVGATSPSYTPGLLPSDQPTSTASPTTPTPTATSSVRPSPPVLPPEPGGPSESAGGGSGVRWPLLILLALPVLLLLGALPRLARIFVRRRRWALASTPSDLAEAAWAELRDSMIDLRLPWDDRVTVRVRARDIGPLFSRRPGKGEEHLARVVRSNPEAQAALDRIVLLIERARYARTTPAIADLKGDVRLCVDSLRVGVERGVRRRADWLPVSMYTRSRPRTRGDAGIALSEPSLMEPSLPGSS